MITTPSCDTRGFTLPVRPDAGVRARGGPGRHYRATCDGTTDSAVAEFPMIAVLIILIALAVVQAALILHTRNTLIDAAVQGAHHASLVGADPDDGAARAEQLIQGRFGGSYQVDATATEDGGRHHQVHVTRDACLWWDCSGPAGTLTRRRDAHWMRSHGDRLVRRHAHDSDLRHRRCHRRYPRPACDARRTSNTIVEFVALSAALLIPSLYLVLTLGSVQAAVFAADTIARDAARIHAVAPDPDCRSRGLGSTPR